VLVDAARAAGAAGIVEDAVDVASSPVVTSDAGRD
jgi:hypothetical protein